MYIYTSYSVIQCQANRAPKKKNINELIPQHQTSISDCRCQGVRAGPHAAGCDYPVPLHVRKGGTRNDVDGIRRNKKTQWMFPLVSFVRHFEGIREKKAQLLCNKKEQSSASLNEGSTIYGMLYGIMYREKNIRCPD